MGDKLQKINIVALLFIMMMLLTACASKSAGTTWQEQYDLGMQYLTDGDYEAAIVAFTAAIEIEPNETDVYLARASAYAMYTDSDEYLTYAITDYETVLSLDATVADAYLGLADIYVMLGDYDSTVAILKEGLEATGNNQSILDKLESLLVGIVDSADTEDSENTEDAADYAQFMSHPQYVDFNELDSWKQLLIEEFFESVQSLDEDAIINIAENFMTEVDYGTSVYWTTIWNEYKVSCRIKRDDDDGNPNTTYTFEIRPENGISYYVRLELIQLTDVSKITDGSWWEYFYFSNILYGQCVNWQWNGEATLLSREQNLWQSASGSFNETTAINKETGIIIENLRDGEWPHEYNTSDNWNGTLTETNGTYSRTYQNGILIEKDGESVEESENETNIYNIYYGARTSYESYLMGIDDWS